jgi:DNA-binding transcriptional regulator PaaX
LLARARARIVAALSREPLGAHSRRWLVTVVLEPGRLPPMTEAIVSATLSRLVVDGTLVRTQGARRQAFYRLSGIGHARVLDKVGS